MNIKGISIIIVYLIILILLIYLIIQNPEIAEAIGVVILVLTPIGALLFQPIRKQLQSFVESLFIKESIHRICIFGRAGSGKTTFIENAFTINPDRIIKSTEDFDYYEFKLQLNLTNYYNVAIADYRGQDAGQIIIDADPNIFGTRNFPRLNSLIFIVDIIPRKVDDNTKIPWNEEDLLEWVKKNNTIKIIEDRIWQHYQYINEATIQLLFRNFYSKNLKKVRFIINKVNLLDKLVNNGHISLPGYSNTEEYVKHKFQSMINYINDACYKLEIDDFSVSIINAKDISDLRKLVLDLITERK